MKLFNYELEHFIMFLYNLKLPNYQSRMRTRLLKLLSEKYKELEDDRLSVIKEYAELDEKGEPVLIRDGSVSKYNIKNKESFEKAMFELFAEEVIIDQTEERSRMLIAVRDSVLNCDLEFEGNEAIQYDRWCEIVEEIKN